MSKKILKRSLALGALMAFVITGQAWADNFEKKTSDETKNTISNVSWDGNGFNIKLQGQEEFSAGSYAVGGQNQTTNLKGYSEIVFAKQYESGFLANNAAASIILGEVDDDGNVVDRIGTIRQEDGSYVDIFFSPQNGVINAYVDNIYMNNVGNAIYAQNGANLLIDATGDVEFGTTYNCTLVGSCCLSENYVDVQNTVTINANNLKLTAPNGVALGVTSYKWTTNEPPYDELTGKNLLDVNVKNNVEIDARISVEAKNGTLPGNAVIDIDAENEVKLTAVEKGINARENGTVNVDATKTTITTYNENGTSYGIDSRAGSSVNVIGDLAIAATSTDDYAIGAYAVNGADITLGNEKNKADINITANSLDENKDGDSEYDQAFGIWAYANANDNNVKVFADELIITAKGTNGAVATGVYSSSTDATGVGKSTIEIDATKTTITATADKVGNAVAMQAFSDSELFIKGALEATGDYVLVTRGNATVKINESAKNTVNLTGDICFAEPGEVIDADVLVNLSDDKSTFKGNIYSSNADRTNEIRGMKINLSNGAQWELSKASVVNQATFGENTVLILKEGSTFEKQADASKDVYALNAGGGTENKLTVANGAKLQIGGIKETTYNIATGFASYDVAETLDIADNALLQANKKLEGNNYQVEVKAKEASQMATDTGISESTAELVQSIIEGAGNENKTPEQEAAVEFINNVIANNATDAAVGNAINSATKMAEAGGNSATAASIVKNVTGVTNDRLSFNCGHSAPHKGGHGVGLFEEGSGADIWVEYVHGKDKVEDMPSTAGASSYEGQYNGIVMGVDFKKVNKFQSGIAFNYGEGDTNSVGNAIRTHSDYDFWGVGYYGNIHNDDSNIIFDINYAKTDSDVTQNNSTTVFEASPETTTWSAGVKVEKLYQNENVQIVPYTGLRYMSIDSDDYATKDGAFMYSMDRQDIWLLPLGVSIRQEIANDNGWTVSPRVDLSYIWAFGDTNSNMEVKSPFAGVSQLGYDVMDDGSFLGLVGVEAHKGQWGYGVAYSYQKGDHSESKKWYVDVNYSF